jgi:magnesium-transporting ATPase (P-type)
MDAVSPMTPRTPWHTRPPDQVLEELEASPQGLTQDLARERRERFGPNRLRPPERRGPLARFLLQFHNVLIYVLLAAGLVTALLGDWVDTSVIFGVVLINALIGFIQEGKAEKALESIRNLLSLQAQVLREGKRVSLPAEEVVPGDIVFLQSGEKVAADLRLVKVKNLRVDESVLTGESVPVEKSPESVDVAAVVGDRTCMAYSGTLVTYGQGTGVVVATGDATEIGRIGRLLAEVESLVTPLLRQMAQFGRWLSLVIVVVAAATFAFGWVFQGYSAVEMFMAAVSLAVAAIPEGLPAIMTITLAIGVQRMARRNAIIRRLPAVETLGSVTVICSDKTGTLTRNEMTAQRVVTAEHSFEVSGVGYDPRGGFALDGRVVSTEEHPDLVETARAGLLCSDAHLHWTDASWRLEGDPTEGALVALAHKAGLDPRLEQERLPRTDVIPFESEHRFMATLHHDHAGHGFIYLKGAPQVLELCSTERRGGEDRRLAPAFWQERMREVAARGQRLLAVAFKVAAPGQREIAFADVKGGLSLLGLFGLIDPPREEAISAVRECQSAGIRVKMITGDHALTARAIGTRMGIGDGRRALTGEELEALSDAELRERAAEVGVFARASPEHKLRLVKALQADGRVVAMTGDGVNDAPALKRADVGIAMGVKGTEAAKEAAEMVLADDNFATIANAVEEGRTVYDNLKKALVFILPTNSGQGLVLIAAIFLGFGHELPITPVQILWVNMVVAVTLALALAFEPMEADVMRRPPRDPGESILSALLLRRVAFVGAVLVAGAFGVFLWEYRSGAEIEAARTLAVNTLVLSQVFYLFNARYITQASCTWRGIAGNRYVLLASALTVVIQLAFTYLPPMQRLFGTAPIGAGEWLRAVAVAVVLFVLVEVEKALRRRRLGHQPRAHYDSGRAG